VPADALGTRPDLQLPGQSQTSLQGASEDLKLPAVADAAPSPGRVARVEAHVYFFQQQHPHQRRFKTFDLTADVRPNEVNSLRFSTTGDDSLHLAWLDSASQQVKFKRVEIIGEENQLIMKRQEQMAEDSSLPEPPLSLEYFRLMFNGKKFPFRSSSDGDEPFNIDLTLCLDGPARPTLQGRAVQADPMEPALSSPGTKRLKLKYHKLLSHVALKSNLRRYSKETSLGIGPPCTIRRAPTSTWRHPSWGRCRVPSSSLWLAQQQAVGHLALGTQGARTPGFSHRNGRGAPPPHGRSCCGT